MMTPRPLERFHSLSRPPLPNVYTQGAAATVLNAKKRKIVKRRKPRTGVITCG